MRFPGKTTGSPTDPTSAEVRTSTSYAVSALQAGAAKGCGYMSANRREHDRVLQHVLGLNAHWEHCRCWVLKQCRTQLTE